ncbi:MAG: rod shape-determining protein [Cytophagales bacterium]|nr:rod shape-determining protein [Cytophagales bacterium]
MGFWDFFVEKIAIDLGTANTLIIYKDEIVVNEPSIIAIDRSTSRIISVGKDAMQMHEKTHQNIKTIRPLKDGVIADFHAAEWMIRSLIRMIKKGRMTFFPNTYVMVICIPSGITEVEKRAVRDSAEHAGAREVYMIHEPIAAAIGIDINIHRPVGSMIVDIGGGTTEIAVIALSGIVCNQSIRIGGDTFNKDIMDYIRRQHNLLIGERTAERVKMEAGAALTEMEDGPEEYPIRGRDLMSGVPKVIKVSYSEVAFALEKSISKIEEAILKALENSPPELSADIYDNGIHLAGGGALLRGLARRLQNKTKLTTHISEDPLTAVARGTGIAMNNLKEYRSVLIT